MILKFSTHCRRCSRTLALTLTQGLIQVHTRIRTLILTPKHTRTSHYNRRERAQTRVKCGAHALGSA